LLFSSALATTLKNCILTHLIIPEDPSFFAIKMAAISVLNPKAEVARAAQALAVNMSGAKVS
jgi:hypothetical protein